MEDAALKPRPACSAQCHTSAAKQGRLTAKALTHAPLHDGSCRYEEDGEDDAAPVPAVQDAAPLLHSRSGIQNVLFS